MSAILELLGVALFLFIYFSFFPSLYLLTVFKKYWYIVLVLGIVAVCGGLFFRNTEAFGLLYVMFLASFLASGCLLVAGIVYHLSLPSIFLIVHIPVLVTSLYYLVKPGTFRIIHNFFSSSFASLGKLEQAGAGPGYRESLAALTEIASRLFFSLWTADLSLRLIISGFALQWIQSNRGINLNIPQLRNVKYSDWLIWTVITGLTGVFLSLYFPRLGENLYWYSLSLLIIMAPLYFLRGTGVISARIFEKKSVIKWPLYLKIMVFLLLFWFWPYIVIITIIIGILDTWMDFRTKGTIKKSEN